MTAVDQSIRDKAWEAVQVKAFTHWVNTFLGKRGKKIESLADAFADGLTIIHFLELLTEKTVKSKYNKKPVMRIALIENTHLALQFLKQCGLEPKFITLSSEDMVDKNLKLLLGFLWTLFRKFSIAAIAGAEDKSTEEGLLMWCRQVTAGYDGVNINNFSDSFGDGLAFLAMIDKYDDNILKYPDYKTKSNQERIEDAFNLAEKNLGVPKLLDVQELLNGTVDERSVVLYVSLYFHAFVSNEEKKKEREAREAAFKKSKEEATETIENLKAQLQSSRKENERLKLELDSLNAEHIDLSGKYSEASEQLTKIKGGLSSTKEEKEGIQAKYNNLLREKEELEEKYKKAKRLISERDERIAILEKEARELSESKAKLEAKLKDTKEDYEKKLVEKEERVEALEEEVEKLTKENEHLQDELREWKMKYNKLKERAEEREKLELLGLDQLRKNLIEHCNDMNVWKVYLEQEREYPSETIIQRSEKEIEGRPFDAQVLYLTDALDSENKKLQVLLKQREIEEEEAKQSKKPGEGDKKGDKKEEKKAGEKKQTGKI